MKANTVWRPGARRTILSGAVCALIFGGIALAIVFAATSREPEVLPEAGREPVLRLGPTELLYHDSQIPFYYDGTMATVQRNKDELFFYATSGIKTYKFAGRPDSPLSELIWVKSFDSYINRNGLLSDIRGLNIWIQNIYVTSGGEYINFGHIEKFPTGGGYDGTEQYSIGILYSHDHGESWIFCGEIIQPVLHESDRGNVGGVPVLVVGDYFYVYYNERGTPSTGVAVARARVDETLAAAAAHTVRPWVKYANGVWSEDAMTGAGSVVVPCADASTDAAYNSHTGQYLFLAPGNGMLKLYRSSDGLVWYETALIDEDAESWFVFATFAGLGTGNTADCLTVGRECYVVWPRKRAADYMNDTLYARKLIWE